MSSSSLLRKSHIASCLDDLSIEGDLPEDVSDTECKIDS
jgi:hypothetical protein